MRFGRFIGVILALALIASCTTSKPPVSSPTPTPATMPLASGNTWVYSKTIYPGKDVFFYRSIPTKSGGIFRTIGRGSLSHPGTHTETYSVKAKTEDGLWEIDVESDTSARDGRYGGSKKIYWQTVKGAQGLAAFVVEQRIIYDIESLPPGWKEEVVDPPIAEYTEAWIFQNLDGTLEYAIYLTSEPSISWLVSNRPVTITTKAGTFVCAEIVEDVHPKEEPKNLLDPFEGGWKTTRYFSPGVGIVKETQQDRGGELMYYLELTAYRLINQ